MSRHAPAGAAGSESNGGTRSRRRICAPTIQTRHVRPGLTRERELARLVTKKRQLSPSTTPSSRLTVNAAVRAILENLRPINDTRTDE